MNGPTLVHRLDELMLLRSCAEAYDRYDAQLRDARGRAVTEGKIVQPLELMCAKAEVDMLVGLWKLRFGHQPPAPASALERARLSGAL